MEAAMRATWYTLEDGSAVDPNEVTRDETGALVHKNGMVAVGDHGNYRTTGVDLSDDGEPLFGGKGDHDKNGSTGGGAPAAKTDTVMEPAPKPAPAKKPGYKTRKAK
jgi:hypothetical protein